MATKTKVIRDTQWYVLECESGGYLGTVWQGNSSGGLVCPRKAVVDSLAPPPYHFVDLCCGKANADAEARRAEDVLPQGFHPVPVRFVGSGPKNSKIVLQ